MWIIIQSTVNQKWNTKRKQCGSQELGHTLSRNVLVCRFRGITTEWWLNRDSGFHSAFIMISQYVISTRQCHWSYSLASSCVLHIFEPPQKPRIASGPTGVNKYLLNDHIFQLQGFLWKCQNLPLRRDLTANFLRDISFRSLQSMKTFDLWNCT